MDRFSEIRAFVTVAELGSFVAASDRLELSRAMVTKLVSALEARLGVRLMHRTTRRLSLTSEGESYLEEASALLSELDDLESRLSAGATRPAGRLRVTVPVSFGVHYLGRLVSRFQERYPEVVVELSLNDRRIDLVEEGYDVGLRVARLTDSSLIARRLAPISAGVCAAPSYLERHGIPLEPEQLSQHNCLLYTLMDQPGVWDFAGRDGNECKVRVDGSLKANNGDMLVDAACQGLGIVRQPHFLVDAALRDGRLLPLLPDWYWQHLDLYAVYPARRHVPGKVRVFVDFLLEFFGRPQSEWR
ncbi:LysR family transcriptional regulator [Paludibacterium yongneupense]|uniref:LysR family transcriptional regulator n=1 Tax=Paludibacterium yongneupense TaxID=400061 RepID=UPI000420A496|nr:LysR family transcriptional regulator [Paludibacterium yongneupense]